MRKLELLKELSESFEFTFIDADAVRVVEWVGFDNESSLRKALKSLRLSELEKELKQMVRSGDIKWHFDDESLHIEFLFSEPMVEAVKLELDWDDDWGWDD